MVKVYLMFLLLVTKNDRVVNSLTGLPWYLLPLKSQRNIAHILNRAQHGAVLTMGPFAALNYETATSVN